MQTSLHKAHSLRREIPSRADQSWGWLVHNVLKQIKYAHCLSACTKRTTGSRLLVHFGSLAGDGKSRVRVIFGIGILRIREGETTKGEFDKGDTK